MAEETIEKEKNINLLLKEWSAYLLSKAAIIIGVAIMLGILGVVYAWMQKPKYTAEITFAPENDKGSGGLYAGIAAQFGVDLGGGSGGIFDGENMILFLKSKMLLEKTLFTPVDVDGKKELMINYYIRSHELNKDWEKNDKLKDVAFINEADAPLRARDSILNNIVRDLSMDLVVEKISKTGNVISVRLTDSQELFPKLLVETIVANGIEYYKDYRSKKNKENVGILQHQTDSVRGLVTNNIVAVAQSTDLNVNPIRQVVRTGAQRQQLDVQVNGQVYGELLKQLELSKITLRKETPFVQILDTPRLPLEKKKLGRLLAGVLFGFLGGFMAIAFFVIKKLVMNNSLRS